MCRLVSLSFIVFNIVTLLSLMNSRYLKLFAICSCLKIRVFMWLSRLIIYLLFTRTFFKIIIRLKINVVHSTISHTTRDLLTIKTNSSKPLTHTKLSPPASNAASVNYISRPANVISHHNPLILVNSPPKWSERTVVNLYSLRWRLNLNF